MYSCSNDGTLKAWSIDNLELKKTLTTGNEEIIKLCFADGKLYSGDDKGNVRLYKATNLNRMRTKKVNKSNIDVLNV